ncbi:MAG TPA: cyclase family protein [Planctomycetota bacterium]|nr:cyclase family protein [Planctomycetota bacterium]
MSRAIDLSHVVHDGLVTYPGLPAARIATWLSREESRASYAPGTEFHIGTAELLANTGTYLDAPFHRYADGADLAGLELARLVDLECVVLRVGDTRTVTAAHLPDDLPRGGALLVHTGWARHFGTPAYGAGHPHLDAGCARALAAAGLAVVGIDSLNIDGTDDGERPVHSALLGAGTAIVEHLRGLEDCPARGARFFAAPLALRGMGSFSVRAFALAP